MSILPFDGTSKLFSQANAKTTNQLQAQKEIFFRRKVKQGTIFWQDIRGVGMLPPETFAPNRIRLTTKISGGQLPRHQYTIENKAAQRRNIHINQPALKARMLINIFGVNK